MLATLSQLFSTRVISWNRKHTNAVEKAPFKKLGRLSSLDVALAKIEGKLSIFAGFFLR